MVKIRCVCCHNVAEVSGTHEFKALENCRNRTYIEVSATGVVRIAGKRNDLIRIWDEAQKKYVPLVES